ncbi:MAG: glycosyltransferase [Solirubrobacteraceae bacterium]
MARVSVVVVSFHSEATLGAAVASIPDAVELIVVEQSATGHAAEVVAEHRPGTRVVQAGANRGFGAGCNLGAANATGDVLVFLNPDARLVEGTYDDLAQAVVDRGGAIVGPALRDEDGHAITRARHWMTPARRVTDLLLPRHLQPAATALDIPDDDPRYLEGGEVDYIQGACMAVGREAFFAAGGFDESFFLYGEEEHLAFQLRRRGLGSFLEPSVVVEHIGATSTDLVSGFATRQLFRSTVLSFRNQLGRGPAIGGAVAVGAALAILLVTTPLRRLVGFRRDQGVAWCWHGIRGVVAGVLGRPVRPPSVDAGAAPAWIGTSAPARPASASAVTDR